MEEEKLHIIFDLVLKEIQNTISGETHVSFIQENECEIYVYKERLEKGWLWNNLVPEKQILYKIEPIACLNINDIQIDNKECQTNNNICENLISQESQTNILLQNSNCQESQTDILQQENYDDIDLLSENSFKSSNDNINYFEDISWGQDFKYELQNKLNLENFGLYNIDKHFKQD
jgi:hypothetical protein